MKESLNSDYCGGGGVGGNYRTVKILKNNQWEDIEFKDLKFGMTFKLFEPDGNPVIYKNNNIFIADSDAHDKDFQCNKLQVRIKE